METKNNNKQSLGTSSIILLSFSVFALAFVSLGGAESFRSEKSSVVSSVSVQDGIDSDTVDFLNTYTPYFTYFVK